MTKDAKETFQVLFDRDPESGKLTREFWKTQEGHYYCPHGPAITCWDEKTGEVTGKTWYNEKGQIHRDGDQPARISINPYSKIVVSEEYFVNGKRHRLLEGAPATIYRDPVNGRVTFEEWRENNKIHRGRGLPALICRVPESGIVTYEGYYKNGEFVDAIERDPNTGLPYEHEEAPKPRCHTKPRMQ